MSWGAMAGAMFDSVKQAASSTYDSLSGRPTVVECDKCNKELAVPVNLFMWGCPTCQSINDLDDSMCKKAGCKTLQPANPNKQLMACGVCGNHVKVPSTNAGKHAKAGVKMAKAGFSFATGQCLFRPTVCLCGWRFCQGVPFLPFLFLFCRYLFLFFYFSAYSFCGQSLC